MNYSDAQIENLKMRKAVGIILIRNDGFVWTGKRKLGPGVRPGEYNLWQMPQGGIDEGEEPKDAAFREEVNQQRSYLNLKIGLNIDCLAS